MIICFCASIEYVIPFLIKEQSLSFLIAFGNQREGWGKLELIKNLTPHPSAKLPFTEKGGCGISSKEETPQPPLSINSD